MANAPDIPGYKPNRIWEIRTTVKFVNFKIRVWTESLVFKFGPDPRVLNICQAFQAIGKTGEKDILEIVERIEALGNIADVEVTDHNENGVCLYPDWQ